MNNNNNNDPIARQNQIKTFFYPPRDWSFARETSGALPIKSAGDDDVIIASSEALPGKAIAHNPWNAISSDLEEQTEEDKWSDLDGKRKVARVTWVNLRIILVLLLLYLFICSLDLMQASFQLIGGRTAGSVLTNSALLNNPVAAMMVGILITVLLQSSSSSSSIIVSMIAAGMLEVEQSIPMIMGANIGTSVTSTIVSMVQSGDHDTFRRAFAGATVHDMFNWLTVIILLPIESVTHYLFHLTDVMVRNISPSMDTTNPQFLNVITDPLSELIIKIDKNVIGAITHDLDRQKFPLAMFYCKEVNVHNTVVFINETDETFIADINSRQFTFDIETNFTSTGKIFFSWYEVLHDNSTKCSHLFTGVGTEHSSLGELTAGLILLAFSLALMIICLLLMVKILNSLLRGSIASLISKWIYASLPGRAAFLTGYLAILLGAIMTFLVQSSSVFTSTLTPLVGLGIVRVDTMYPLTLGSNIGTTFTSFLAALTAGPETIQKAIQISLCHFFFNITGILMFYPVPILRRVPIRMAKFMGDTTAKYRWFAAAYLLVVFFIMPGMVFALSLAGWYVLLAVALPLAILVLLISILNVTQSRCASRLPQRLQTWHWLPAPLRSLAPYDALLKRACFRHKCCQKRCQQCQEAEESSEFDDETLYIVPKEWTGGGDNLSPMEIVDVLEVGTPERVINITAPAQTGHTTYDTTNGQSGIRGSRESYMYHNPAYTQSSEVFV